MARLVAQFNGSSASLEERLKVLLDLEYMVHQVSSLEKWNTGSRPGLLIWHTGLMPGGLTHLGPIFNIYINLYIYIFF